MGGGGGEYQVISLMEVVWKVVIVIINCCLISSISFHVMMHVFLAGHGTGSVSLMVKMLQQLTTLT